MVKMTALQDFGAETAGRAFTPGQAYTPNITAHDHM